MVVTGCRSPTASNKARVESLLSTRWDRGKQIAAPTTLDTQPWKVGQWAIYKTVHGNGAIAFERISVIAADSCGVWIEWVQEYEPMRTKWLLCVQWEPNPTNDAEVTKGRIQMGIRQIENYNPIIFDFRGRQDVDVLGRVTANIRRRWSLVSRQAIPDSEREDVDVPAGHFNGAVREKVGLLEIWSHPDVPFGGVVKVQEEPIGEEVLVAYGSSGGHSDAPEVMTLLAQALPSRTIAPLFWSFGFGRGHLTGHGVAAGSDGVAFAFETGIRVTRRVDLVADVASADVPYSPDPLMTLTSMLVLVGARWSPFRAPPTVERRLYDVTSLHVQTGVGYSDLQRTSTETVARGVAASAILGWLPIQGRDWSLGVEVADRVAFYNSGEGVRHNLFVFWVVQLWALPRAR